MQNCPQLFKRIVRSRRRFQIKTGSNIQTHISNSYQHQFVKTPFARIWSNRDMSLFSFLSISPQFAYQSSHKASEMWSHMGEGLKGTILHALDMVFRLFWGFLWVFCNEKLFSKAFFQHFLHFQFIKTPSHRKKVAISTRRCFDKLQFCQKRWEGFFTKAYAS